MTTLIQLAKDSSGPGNPLYRVIDKDGQIAIRIVYQKTDLARSEGISVAYVEKVEADAFHYQHLQGPTAEDCLHVFSQFSSRRFRVGTICSAFRQRM
ncbi:MAG: hypothetical protein U0V70_16310 [Terriglobia bacterium]